MSIFVTGDTHNDFSRLSYNIWPFSKNLNKKDLLIILGDFGLLFNNCIEKKEKYLRRWLNERS
jgi:predicted phosphodiesterase